MEERDKIMQKLLKDYQKNPLKRKLQVDARRERLDAFYKEKYGKYPDGKAPE